MKYCQFKGLNHSSFLSLITWVTWSLTEEYFCKALLPSKSTPPNDLHVKNQDFQRKSFATFTKSKNSFTVVCCGCFLVINERQRKNLWLNQNSFDTLHWFYDENNFLRLFTRIRIKTRFLLVQPIFNLNEISGMFIR